MSNLVCFSLASVELAYIYFSFQRVVEILSFMYLSNEVILDGYFSPNPNKKKKNKRKEEKFQIKIIALIIIRMSFFKSNQQGLLTFNSHPYQNRV